jgi:hypothetical protein
MLRVLLCSPHTGECIGFHSRQSWHWGHRGSISREIRVFKSRKVEVVVVHVVIRRLHLRKALFEIRNEAVIDDSELIRQIAKGLVAGYMA